MGVSRTPTSGEDLRHINNTLIGTSCLIERSRGGRKAIGINAQPDDASNGRMVRLGHEEWQLGGKGTAERVLGKIERLHLQIG